MIDGFVRGGHRVTVFELAQLTDALRREPGSRGAILEQFARAVAGHIAQERVDVSVAMWANALTSLPAVQAEDGRVVSFFDALKSPHLCYWLDAPHWAAGGQWLGDARAGRMTGPMLFHAINNEGTADEMRRVLGMGQVRAVPYGVAPSQYGPPSEATVPTEDLIFFHGLGDPPPTPQMLAEVVRDEPDVEGVRAALARGVLPALSEEVGDGALARALLDGQLGERDVPMLARLDAIARAHASFSARIGALLGDAERFVRATALVRSIDGWHRSFVYCWLSRRFRCVHVGGQAMDAWPCEGAKLPYIADVRRLGGVYARARVALSVMRWQDDVGVHIKPIEAACAGVPCLAMRRPGLDAILTPGSEVLVFDTLPEAARLLRGVLDDEPRRLRIASAARERTVREHSWQARVPEMLGWIGAATGRW